QAEHGIRDFHVTGVQTCALPISGLEFLRGIPGTVGGFVRMNGGAYGREVADILLECEVLLRSGERRKLPREALGYSYRHSELPRSDERRVGKECGGAWSPDSDIA